VVLAGKAGQLITRILDEGFEVSALEMFFLDRHTADEFFELYKGVVPEYSQMIDQVICGPCIALEVRQENAVVSLKQLCGGFDPNIAKTKGERGTLRQEFGVDRARNAVHCTDVPEEGILECEFFFVLLPEKLSKK